MKVEIHFLWSSYYPGDFNTAGNTLGIREYRKYPVQGTDRESHLQWNKVYPEERRKDYHLSLLLGKMIEIRIQDNGPGLRADGSGKNI